MMCPPQGWRRARVRPKLSGMSPVRIVSLVPSLTEFVCWLGRGERLVGRTRFCVEPAAEVADIPVIGGTKNPDVARIRSLAPDLVIANKEENRREDVEAIRAAGWDVLVTDPNTLPEARAMLLELGARLDARERALQLDGEIEAALAAIPERPPKRVAVAVWKQPFMALGAATYGHDLIERAGGVNVAADLSRYPELSLAELAARGPELILLPDEPYAFKEADRAAFGHIAPAVVVDGRLLWWYGPRIPEALRTLSALFGETP